MNLVTPKAGAEHELLFTDLREIELMLSCNLRCSIIHNHNYVSGHTLL
jgi:hypothetical protein